jgi:hypothetical protein
LAAVAAAATFEAALRHAVPAVRQASRIGAVVVVALLVVIVVVPDAITAKRAAAPGSPVAPSLLQLTGLREDDGLEGAVSALRPEQWSAVFVIDVPWTALHHPFAERADHVAWALTTLQAPLEGWVGVLEGSNATVVHVEATALSPALLRTYADCVQATSGDYVVLDAARCPGRLEQLRREVGDGY